MKNQTVKIQKNGGYMFNTVSKQLEKYEFISCKFNFLKNEVQYKCRLGGVEKIIEDNNLKVYASESDYKKGSPLGLSEWFFARTDLHLSGTMTNLMHGNIKMGMQSGSIFPTLHSLPMILGISGKMTAVKYTSHIHGYFTTMTSQSRKEMEVSQ